jgi:hypothetical protein
MCDAAASSSEPTPCSACVSLNDRLNAPGDPEVLRPRQR